MDTQRPEALRLAGVLRALDARSRFANAQLTSASEELEILHAENEALRASYDAALDEIASLQARVQELGQMARDVNSRRVIELEAQLAAVGAGGVSQLVPAQCMQQSAEPASERPAAPDGWKLVPTGRATGAMVLAASRCTQPNTSYSDLWRVMLAAAPQPPASCIQKMARGQDEALIRQLVEALEVTASDVCQVAHHKKRDQHGHGDVCPVQARHDEAIAAGRARLECRP